MTTRKHLQTWLNTSDTRRMERFVNLLVQGRSPAQAVRAIQGSDSITEQRQARGYVVEITAPSLGGMTTYIHKNGYELTTRSCDVKVWKTYGWAQRWIDVQRYPDARVVTIGEAHAIQWGVWI